MEGNDKEEEKGCWKPERESGHGEELGEGEKVGDGGGGVMSSMHPIFKVSLFILYVFAHLLRWP